MVLSTDPRQHIKMPYYAQTAEFTCGPACVLMILKHFDPHLKLNRTLEFEVWRQCNMIGVRGADPFGMSVPLLAAGCEVHLATQRRTMLNLDLWKNRLREHRFTLEDARLAVFAIAGNRKRALGRGLSVEYGRITVERIAGSIDEGFIPVTLVHMGVVHQFDIPHWVVVTGVGKDHVTLNDPYPPKGGKGIRVRRDEFQTMLDDIGTRIGMSPSTLFIRNSNQRKNQTPATGIEEDR
jgi:hypothetical protein